MFGPCFLLGSHVGVNYPILDPPNLLGRFPRFAPGQGAGAGTPGAASPPPGRLAAHLRRGAPAAAPPTGGLAVSASMSPSITRSFHLRSLKRKKVAHVNFSIFKVPNSGSNIG